MSEPLVLRRIVITEELHEDGERFLSIETEPEDQLMKWDALGMLRWAVLNCEGQMGDG